MRKFVTRPDGKTEWVEGTPDEIIEYERLLGITKPLDLERGREKPGILKGSPFSWEPWTLQIVTCSDCRMSPCSCWTVPWSLQGIFIYS